MIVSRRSEGLVVIRQVDHQEQCGLMADAWGNGEFGRLDPWWPVRDAAAWHDEGWRSWETWPHIGDDGRPVDFPDIDRSQHVRLYSEGIRWAADRSAQAGLLVSMHGQGLYERRLGLDGVPPPRPGRRMEIGAFLAGQDALQEQLAARLGDGPQLRAWAWGAYRLLQAWDLLSLYLVWRALPGGEPGTMRSVPRTVDDPGVAMRLRPSGPASCACQPYPFREDPVSLPVAARLIEDRAYGSHQHLRDALADAEWLTMDLVVHGG